jgi:hypothetical protein
VAPVITGITKHFMFHIRSVSVLKFLYFNFFLDSFCITYLSDGTDHLSVRKFYLIIIIIIPL